MKITHLILAFSILPTIGFAQLGIEIPTGESVPESYSDTDLRFLKTYSEENRWAVFEAENLKIFQEEDPIFSPVWEDLGPNTIDTLSGRVTALAFHPNNPDILYAGTGAGGVFKSENEGENWFPLTDDLPSMFVGAVAINPHNPDEILIGTGLSQIITVALQPGVGVLKSTDGGKNWDRTSFNFNVADGQTCYELVYDPEIPGRVYLGASNGFWISDDGGENWRNTNPRRIYEIQLRPDDSKTIFIGAQNWGLQSSTDGGETWTTVSNGLPTGGNVARTNMAICKSQPDIMVAKLISGQGFNTLGIYRSIDGGISWTPLPSPPDDTSCQPGQPNSCVGWLFSTIGIAPDDPNKIFVGGVQFWVTQDGGLTWFWKDYLSNGSGGGNKDLVYVDNWDIQFDQSRPGRVYVCCDGGVIRSDDYGITWNRMSNDMLNAMVYSVDTDRNDPNFMVGGFHDHGLQRLRGSNGNKTWERWSNGDGIRAIIDHQNSNILYGNNQFGPVIKSLNGGQGTNTSFWASAGIQESGPWASPLVMDPVNSRILYTASNTRIYRTLNGAGNWLISANIPGVQTLEVSPHNPNFVYAHSFNSSSWAIHRSENRGASWETISNLTIPSWGTTALHADPIVPNRIYATRNSSFPGRDHIKVSDDNGDTWRDISGDFPDIKVYDIMVNPYNEQQLFLGTELGVYFTDNQGVNWYPFNNNLPKVKIFDLNFSPADSTLRAATFGRGIWKTSLRELMISSGVSGAIFTPEIDVSVMPNPAADFFNLKIEMSNSMPLSGELLDGQGRVVLNIFDSNQPVSFFEKQINLSGNLPSGVYFLKIRAGIFLAHRKVILK